jgi:hypothetical protein
MTLTRRLALTGVLASAALSLPALMTNASAQTSSPNPDAVAHFNAGTTKFQAQDYAGAIAEWKITESIETSPGLFFNMAVAYKDLGDSKNALLYYQKFLKTAPANDPDRADAQQNVKELQANAQSSQGSSQGQGQAQQQTQGQPPNGPNDGQQQYAQAGYQGNQNQGNPYQGGYGNTQYQGSPGYAGGPPPPPTLEQPLGPYEQKTLGIGVDVGAEINAGAFDTDKWTKDGLGLRVTLDLDLAPSAGIWGYATVAYGVFSHTNNFLDPLAQTIPQLELTQIGAGAMWTREIGPGIYLAPRLGLAYGQFTYTPDVSNPQVTAVYSNIGLLVEGSIVYVSGPSVFRLTPIELDVVGGNTYATNSAVPDGPYGIHGGGMLYELTVGYSYIY